MSKSSLRRRIALICCVPFALSSLSSAQWLTMSEFDQHTQKGIDHVYNLEFEPAEKEFSLLVQNNPHHPAGYFFLAMVDWWRILMNIDDEFLDDRFVGKLDVVIDLCDSLLGKNPNDVTALFFKGGSIGFRGRLRANRDSWIKAANDGRLALPIVRRAFAVDPAHNDVLLGIGIYNYYAEVIPERYPLVRPLMVFFPSGDKKKGIEQLTIAARNAKYASIEAYYFLLQLFYTYEHQYDRALEIADQLFRRFSRNVVFHRYLGRCYVSLGRWDDAAATFKEILRRCEAPPETYVGYLHAAKREALYYLGVYAANNGRNEEALGYLYRCDELCRLLDKDGESGFMSMTNLRIGMIYDLQMKRHHAVEQYRKVLRMKKFETSHDQAQQYIKSAYRK